MRFIYAFATGEEGEMGNIEVEGPGAPEPKDELREYGPCFNGF